MKFKEYREKWAKYDLIVWSKCNICHQKYANDEIVQHIHQKHPEKDCSTYSCWTYGIKFRKETSMKHHMKTVEHQLDAKKYKITDESNDKTDKSYVQVILIEAVKHQLEAKKYPITDKSTVKTDKSEVQVILIEAVKHQVEARKHTITDESIDKTDESDTDESTDKTDESEVQVTLIEADLLNEIRIKNTP